MKVAIGNKGLENSWQEPFPENAACVHNCGGVAKPAVCIMEEDRGVSDLRKTWSDDKSDNLWAHDATAFAIYLCPNCLGATALFNQG